MEEKNELNSLESLSEKLDKIRSKNSSNNEDEKPPNYSSLNICSDLIAGIFVGGVIGFQLDKSFGTKPILFIICFLLGNVASGLLIYRNFKK